MWNAKYAVSQLTVSKYYSIIISGYTLMHSFLQPTQDYMKCAGNTQMMLFGTKILSVIISKRMIKEFAFL